MERRFVHRPIECREAESPTIEGLAAVFYRAGDPQTEFGLWAGAVERIAPMAFDRAIQEQDDVRALRNHDPDNLLGRTAAGTLNLWTDATGLRYSIKPPDSELGRSTVEAIRRGDLDGSSFAFIVTEEQWEKQDGLAVRWIRGVELFDVGPVTYPAYQASDVGLRSHIEDARKAFEAANRTEPPRLALRVGERKLRFLNLADRG